MQAVGGSWLAGQTAPIVTAPELAQAPASAYFTLMAQTASIAPNKMANRLLVGAAVVLGAAFAGAAMLWVHYGTAVFFEMIAAGIAMCF